MAIPRGCIDCGTGLRLGRCQAHANQMFSLRQQIRTRLVWLLPRTCQQCSNTFNDWGSIKKLCDECRDLNHSAQRRWMRIKRERRMTGGASNISPARLYEMADRMCALCHRVTDHPRVWKQWVTYKRWIPNAPTVDHIIPLAKGGTHTWDNVQLAHWSCNGEKRDTIVTGAAIIVA